LNPRLEGALAGAFGGIEASFPKPPIAQNFVSAAAPNDLIAKETRQPEDKACDVLESAF
jgi:hypothetical protein